MSDNFVRRNLKRRYKGVKFSSAQLRKRQRAQSYERAHDSQINSKENKLSNHNDGNDEDEEGDNDENAGISSRTTKKSDIAVTVDYMDPLEQSLSYITQSSGSSNQTKSKSMPLIASAVSFDQAKVVRGLNISTTNHRKRDITLRDALLDSRLLTPPLLHLVQQAAPVCPTHGLPTVVRTVRKTGSRHRGRRFFACNYENGSSETRCDYFCWIEDHAPLLSYLPDSNMQEGVTETKSVFNIWIEESVDEYRQKLIRCEKDELVREARFFNKRRQALLGTFRIISCLESMFINDDKFVLW